MTMVYNVDVTPERNKDEFAVLEASRTRRPAVSRFGLDPGSIFGVPAPFLELMACIGSKKVQNGY